ncbi:MAG TPA: alpha/beta hydrolase, partial [Acidimicrobiales bacterium]|nr:alpha/beta hydrolase [Acidimicrobiales bacterium]
MDTARVNGTDLAYIERGSGEPVVLVHGTLGDLRSWELQLDALSRDHRVISYSRRYHHPNPCRGDETDYSAELHADDLAAFISALGLGSAHVVGNSYGAYTALLLAARHPDRVRTLVLGEPPAFPLLEGHPEGQPLRDDFLADVWVPTGQIMARGEIDHGIRTFVDGLFGAGAFHQLPGEVLELLRDNACEFAVEASSPEFFTSFSTAEARRVTTPTLLVSGTDTLRMFELVVDELERCLHDTELVRIVGSS